MQEKGIIGKMKDTLLMTIQGTPSHADLHIPSSLPSEIQEGKVFTFKKMFSFTINYNGE